ncbi:hypothetical protein MUY27_09285 [Mucilaginibacter sp. RS28]|uniref:Uncharacterized protein n=1 Tax=Mucilaginibacter straminoryzae TaxID=2932774 RepID=A0A9X1X3I3_9SPHI|nr:hypothetical protein [Mucilaginibacter straminoryzae]MCJ8209901.1 hypothetical protein [Mucilaginibacter straminoryzae]
MKLKLTPLNFCTAFFIILAIYVWVYGGKAVATGIYQHWTGTIGAVFMLFAVVVSFLDLIFRNFFPQMKNVWIVELSFITLTLVIFFLVK